MYVGGKPSNADALNSATGPTGTYAVEAEGLTVVNGSLAMNPKKRAWRPALPAVHPMSPAVFVGASSVLVPSSVLRTAKWRWLLAETLPHL